MTLPVRVLQDDRLRLEPYVGGLKQELAAALDCDASAWELFAISGQGAHFDAWWAAALEQTASGVRIAYAIRDRASGAVVGTTSFLDIRPQHGGVEIGATFLVPAARSGFTNPAAKRLMLDFAFRHGALRVELLTDLRNLRSQAAIAKLGAVREGVLRNERVTWTGHIRDTVLFSVTDAEWPGVSKALEARLAAFSAAGA